MEKTESEGIKEEIKEETKAETKESKKSEEKEGGKKPGFKFNKKTAIIAGAAAAAVLIIVLICVFAGVSKTAKKKGLEGTWTNDAGVIFDIQSGGKVDFYPNGRNSIRLTGTWTKLESDEDGSWIVTIKYKSADVEETIQYLYHKVDDEYVLAHIDEFGEDSSEHLFTKQ